MGQNFVRIRRKNHPSSMKTRSPLLKDTSKASFPALAEKIIEMSDIILEVLDARFITETRNSEFEGHVKKLGKKIIYVFNKADLIDAKKIKKEEIMNLAPRVFVSAITRRGGRELRDKIKITSSGIKNPIDKALKKVTVGIIGYPNTGKSSIINLLVGKPAAGIGADAGFTKGIQKVGLTNKIVLLDSPGVIPSKEYSSSELFTASRHAKVGARSSSQVRSPEIVVSNLMKEYSTTFDEFYNVSSEGDAEILIEKLGRKKGFLKKNNEVNEDKTARLILKDWQEGKIRIK
jgi:ribosome biogenesis GTPase A